MSEFACDMYMQACSLFITKSDDGNVSYYVCIKFVWECSNVKIIIPFCHFYISKMLLLQFMHFVSDFYFEFLE